MITCPKCQKEFDDPKKYGGHFSSHFRNENYKKDRKKKIFPSDSFYVTHKHICKYCKFEFLTGPALGGHLVNCSQNPNNHKYSVATLSKQLQQKINPDKKCSRCGQAGTVLWLGTQCQKCKLEYYEQYVFQCKFLFDVYQFPNYFDLKLIEEFGWYSPPNRGNNTKGVSRDHILSINEGFKNNIDPKIMSHPANCKIITQSDNSSKHKKSNISLDDLLKKIEEFNKTYGRI